MSAQQNARVTRPAHSVGRSDVTGAGTGKSLPGGAREVPYFTRTNAKVVCVAELSTVQAHTQLRNGLSPSCSFSRLRQGFWPRPPTPPQPTQLCRRWGICSLFFSHHHPPVTCSPGSPGHTAMRWLEAETLPPLHNQKSHQREPLSREPGPILSDPRRAGEGVRGVLRRNICWLGRTHLD